jgi:oxazoline/thiazoline dehydrogenase
LSQSLFLSFRDGVAAFPPTQGEWVLASDSIRITFKQLGPGLVRAFERLAAFGEYEHELAECVRQLEGSVALSKFYLYLDKLTERGLLLRSVKNGSGRLATLTPSSPQFVFPCRETVEAQRYVLSRFAYIRREGEEVVLESPLSYARVILHDSLAATLVHALAKPQTIKDLVKALPCFPPDIVTLTVMLLLNSGMLAEPNADGRSQREDDGDLQSWEFHDLLFHSRSRAGIEDEGIGGFKKSAGRNPPPALKSVPTGETLELYRPDLDRLQCEDIPFARIQGMRCSLREYGAKPITGDQLGEFLYRVGRVRESRNVVVATPAGEVPLSVASRPYPSGGGLYELELYAAINNCDDVTPGLYYYDPLHHRLCKLSGREPVVDKLLAEAALSAQIPSAGLQVLFVVAARFPRIRWKYTGIAYSLILKNVGVIYQTMYLTATAMGLAPCALGCGDAALFARAAGTHCYAETSVGEFLLGSKA